MHDFVQVAEREFNMSFDIICSGCGAVSGPSVGLCPFCKTVMASSHKNNSPQETSISKLYESGKIDWALDLAKKMHTEKKESKSDISFLLLYASF